MTAREIRSELEKLVPTLWTQVNSLSDNWAADILANLNRRDGSHTAFPKTFTDPVLGPVELFEWEIVILDSPLLQRLRGVRQLALAHSVYTGATHDRLSHCLGVVEVCERMIRGLKKNAFLHKNYGRNRDNAIPEPTDEDHFSIRLAALLHDVGHGPFSHATEPVIKASCSEEFDKLTEFLRNTFDGVENVKVSEAISVLFVFSNAMRSVFEHHRFTIPFRDKGQLPISVSARIIGSRDHVTAPYLSGIVSGTIDADKLDYMARDSYFTGLPIGLDVDRLISKLEVVTITPNNVRDPELKERAQKAPNEKLYELGISLSGLTAYEQMIIGRVVLFDRIYYHQKVRCGEAMMRRLVSLAQEERKRPFTLSELFTNVSDDAMIYLLSGETEIEGIAGGGARSKILGRAIRTRHFYHRAFAFAERFIAGLDSLSEREKRNTVSNLWRGVLQGFEDEETNDGLARDIYKLGQQLASAIEDFKFARMDLNPEHVLIDFPENRVAVAEEGDQGTGIFLRTEGGELTDANLYFNPDRWSDAFKNQKHCGFVFCPPQYIALISLASHIIFFQKFNLIFGKAAKQLCKTDHHLKDKWKTWIQQALDAKLCTGECHEALSKGQSRLLLIRKEEIQPPEDWKILEPNFPSRIAGEFEVALPSGLVDSVHTAVIDAFNGLCCAIDTFEKGGLFAATSRPDEKRNLQAELLKALRSQKLDVKEGVEMAGGESDLLLPGNLILENKVVDEIEDPSSVKPEADWQARRYSLSLNQRVSFVLVAYKPASETALLLLPSRVAVYQLRHSPEAAAVVRLLVPWGYDIPSKAKAPRKPKGAS